MKYLFYGGPWHNTIRDVNLNVLGHVEVFKQKPVHVFAAPVSGDYLGEIPIQRFIYTQTQVQGQDIDLQTLIKTDSRAVVMVCDRKKPYEPEKVLRLAERRKVAEVVKSVLQ